MQQPTITISLVCSTPEQLGDVQARVSALEADLQRLGVAFSVTTHQAAPPRPTMTLTEAQRDPQAFVAGFVEAEQAVHFDPELAECQGELVDEPDE